MVDCYGCGAQEWTLDARADSRIRVLCGECGVPYTFLLTDDESGASCADCENDTWDIADWSPTEEWHVILRCTDCGTLAELWLHGDKQNTQAE